MELRRLDGGSAMNLLKRWLFISAGLTCVALGVLGIFVPLMPTTPFLLLAAFFFSKSSPRFLHWLLHNRWFGPYIRNYREGRGMPLRAKIVTLGLMWVTMSVTAYFLPWWWARGLLLAVAVGVTVYVGFRLRTMPATEVAAQAAAQVSSGADAGRENAAEAVPVARTVQLDVETT